jgi:serine/threonine protein kinase
MTCAGCGARTTVERASYCARCLLRAVELHGEAPVLSAADECPPCELLSIMGETARAVTFLGEQTWPVRRLVALKLFRDDACHQLTTAAAHLAVPRHPNIAAVLESGRLAGRPYLVTQYLGGGSLAPYCDRHRLGIEPRMTALLAVTGALAFAHAHGAVHGRLTSSNVLCEPRSPFLVQIMDFDCNGRKVSGDVRPDVLARADLDAVITLADSLLRPVAPKAFDLAGTLDRLRQKASSTEDLRTAFENLRARIPPA